MPFCHKHPKSRQHLHKHGHRSGPASSTMSTASAHGGCKCLQSATNLTRAAPMTSTRTKITKTLVLTGDVVDICIHVQNKGTFRKVLMRKLGLRPCAVCDARRRLATSLTDTGTETCLQGTTSYEVASSSLRMLFARLTWDRAAAARLYMTYSSRHCFLRRLYVLHTSLSVNRESVIWHLATSCTGILQCWYSYGSQDTCGFQLQDTS